MLQNQLRVVLPVPLDVRSLVLDDGLIIVVHGNDISVGPILLILRTSEGVLVQLAVVRDICDHTVAFIDGTFDLDGYSVTN